MNSEIPHSVRQDLGYDLPSTDPLTLDQAHALVATGSTSKEARRIVTRDESVRRDDMRYSSDSESAPLTDEDRKRSHANYLLAREAFQSFLKTGNSK